MANIAISMVIVVLLTTSAHGTVLTHCVNNCTGISNRDYNSCDRCNEFVTCSEGAMTKTPCQNSTFFDADKGICDWSSNTCIESDSTSSPTTQTVPTTVQTTTSQTTTSQSTSSTSNPTTQTVPTTVQTTTSQTTTSQSTSSTSNPTTQTVPTTVQTTTSQTTTSQSTSSTSNPTTQTVPTTVQTTTSQTTNQRTSLQAGVQTCIYVKVQYETAPCVVDTHLLGSTRTRSKIECGSICNRNTKCWHFQHTRWRCLMYDRTSPPCNTDVYKYDI